MEEVLGLAESVTQDCYRKKQFLFLCWSCGSGVPELWGSGWFPLGHRSAPLEEVKFKWEWSGVSPWNSLDRVSDRSTWIAKSACWSWGQTTLFISIWNLYSLVPASKFTLGCSWSQTTETVLGWLRHHRSLSGRWRSVCARLVPWWPCEVWASQASREGGVPSRGDRQPQHCFTWAARQGQGDRTRLSCLWPVHR